MRFNYFDARLCLVEQRNRFDEILCSCLSLHLGRQGVALTLSGRLEPPDIIRAVLPFLIT